jgi:transcriptional regulator with XRE-family HTH domain
MNIGLQLKIARIEKEWTQAELSNATSVIISPVRDRSKPVSVATIINIEKGQGNPKLKTVLRLVEALDHKLKIAK